MTCVSCSIVTPPERLYIVIPPPNVSGEPFRLCEGCWEWSFGPLGVGS